MRSKVITVAVAVLFLAAGMVLYQNRYPIALKLNTDPEVTAVFEGIAVGDTLDEVTAGMGTPLGILEGEGEGILYVKWPRCKRTSFAVKVTDGIVVEKYERFGS